MSQDYAPLHNSMRETPIKNRYPRMREQGLSIVELMIAITIGLLLLAFISQLFITSRSTYRVEEGMARVQETGRFGIDFLSFDVRMAGYTGCLNKSTTVTNNLNNPTSLGTNYKWGQYVYGYAYVGPGTAPGAWNQPLPAPFAANEVVPGTDAILIRHAEPTGVHLKTMMGAPNGDIQIDGNPTLLKKSDIVLIADCKQGDIFQITAPDPFVAGVNNLKHEIIGGPPGPGNKVDTLAKAYDTDAELMKLVTRIYYIGRRGNVATNPPSLFRKEYDGASGGWRTEELLQDVESMKILYATGPVAHQYEQANHFPLSGPGGEFPPIMTVRIGLLVRTPETIDTLNDTNTFNLAGIPVQAANDKRRRHAFNTTIQLRNP